MGREYKAMIWVLNHYAIAPNAGGGAMHYDFAEELVKRGYDVTIFAASFDHKLRVEKLAKREKVRKESSIAKTYFIERDEAMHILYIHQYFTAPEQGSGTRSYEFARRLVKKGH